MIVYHGSYCIVDNPHISFSMDALDFGKGFYVTEIKEQAVNWVNKFKRRGKTGYLNIYKLDIVIYKAVMDAIQESINIKTTLIKMPMILKGNIPNLDGEVLYNDISYFLGRVENELSIKLKSEKTINRDNLAYCFYDRQAKERRSSF